MRTLHLVDDGTNGIVAFRRPYAYATSTLQEGRNILRARLLLKIDEHGDPVKFVGYDAGNDESGAHTDVQAQTTVSPPINRPLKFVAEEMGNQLAMQLRANQEADWLRYPMLIPEGAMAFMIKGIVHRQSNAEGTTTNILLCRFDGLGSGTLEPLQGFLDKQPEDI
jgi:hypothetical protein